MKNITACVYLIMLLLAGLTQSGYSQERKNASIVGVVTIDENGKVTVQPYGQQVIKSGHTADQPDILTSPQRNFTGESLQTSVIRTSDQDAVPGDPFLVKSQTGLRLNGSSPSSAAAIAGQAVNIEIQGNMNMKGEGASYFIEVSSANSTGQNVPEINAMNFLAVPNAGPSRTNQVSRSVLAVQQNTGLNSDTFRATGPEQLTGTDVILSTGQFSGNNPTSGSLALPNLDFQAGSSS